MTVRPPSIALRPLRPLALVCLSLGLGLPLASLAQFKVVGPDGKVTYTDRPPPKAAGKVSATAGGSSGAAGAAATPMANLPLELRQAVGRYPVTLYVLASCDGCEASRQYLKQRGIPYTEKRVGESDGEVLQRITGGREIPALTIGGQVLRGYSADNWASYLDAAGYPRESRLPANYVAPAPTPLVVAVTPAAAPSSAPRPDDAPIAPPPAPGNIRF